jgi:hypothetical protein
MPGAAPPASCVEEDWSAANYCQRATSASVEGGRCHPRDHQNWRESDWRPAAAFAADFCGAAARSCERHASVPQARLLSCTRGLLGARLDLRPARLDAAVR